MDRKWLSRFARGILVIAPGHIAFLHTSDPRVVASAPAPRGAGCDSIQYRFVDDGAPANARRYRDPQSGQSYALRDSIVLDGRGIAQIEVRPRRVGADTSWDVMARLTPTGASALEAATASHVGSMIAVLVGDEIVQTAIIQGTLRTAVIPIRMDLSRNAADSLALHARPAGAACAVPKSPPDVK